MPIDIVSLINQVELLVKPILEGKEVWWQKVLPVAEIVAKRIEYAHENLKGSDKKAAAIQIFWDIWKRYINIKFIPDFFEEKIVKHLFSMCIDSAVASFNKSGIFRHN